jgi:SAM-dependent methyltransferase
MNETRLLRILGNLDFENLTGLEIGPLANPLIVKNGTRKIFYADYENAEFLRSKSVNDPNVKVADIVEIDYVIKPPMPLELGLRFDYIIASHVVEHVPDLIGWLNRLRNWLAPRGIIALATPDYRYCFDVKRTPTTVGDVVGAFIEGREKPSPSTAYDAFRGAVRNEPSDAWQRKDAQAHLEHYYKEETCLWVAKQALNEYIDCHCWVWTANSFQNIWSEVGRLGLTDLMLNSCVGPMENEHEFYIQLSAP